MKYLSQIGLFAFIFVFTSCQAGPENPNTAAPTQKAVVSTVQLPNERAAKPVANVSEEDSQSSKLTTAEQTAEAPIEAKSPAKQAQKRTNKASSIEAVPAPAIQEEVKEAKTSTSTTSVETAPPSPTPTVETPATEVPSTAVSAPTPPVEEETPVATLAAPSHSGWNTLLTQFVTSSGKVNYKGLKAKQKDLEAYLKLLADNPVQTSWSRNEKMAYWINAYNAFTVKLILDNYPLSSITNLSGGKVWDKKWIQLGEETYSLNNIENDILRPRYKDARIHFAVNCAAKSCPPLLNRAWTASNLNTYLDRQAKQFINNSQYNQVSARKVVISKIFEWYAADFGDIVTYLNKYSTTSIKANAQVSYQNYDWALNQ